MGAFFLANFEKSLFFIRGNKRVYRVKKKEFSEEIGKKISFGKIEKINCYFLKMKNQIDEAEMAMNYEKLHQIAKKNGIEEVKYITITDISNKIEKINCYFLKMKNQIDEAEMAMNYEKLHQIAKKNGIEEVKYITITDISNIEKLDRDSIIPVKKIGIIVPNKILLEKSEELYIGEHFLMNFSDSYTSLVESYKNLKKYVINI